MKAGKILVTPDTRVDTIGTLAKESGFSRSTANKVKQVIEKGTPETVQAMKEERISPNKAYQQTKKKEEKPEPQEPEENKIHILPAEIESYLNEVFYVNKSTIKYQKYDWKSLDNSLKDEFILPKIKILRHSLDILATRINKSMEFQIEDIFKDNPTPETKEPEQDEDAQSILDMATEESKQQKLKDEYIKGGGIGGYFSLLRSLFPSITFLGTLYKGVDNSSNCVAFIKDYMGKINNQYNNIGDLIVLIFRHGLMHTQMPKVISVDGLNIGWVITYNDRDHLNVSTIGLKPINIYISPHQLYLDLLNALDFYMTDLTSKPELLDNFKKGFLTMVLFYQEPEIEMNCKIGFEYLRSKINNDI